MRAERGEEARGGGRGGPAVDEQGGGRRVRGWGKGKGAHGGGDGGGGVQEEEEEEEEWHDDWGEEEWLPLPSSPPSSWLRRRQERRHGVVSCRGCAGVCGCLEAVSLTLTLTLTGWGGGGGRAGGIVLRSCARCFVSPPRVADCVQAGQRGVKAPSSPTAHLDGWVGGVDGWGGWVGWDGAKGQACVCSFGVRSSCPSFTHNTQQQRPLALATAMVKGKKGTPKAAATAPTATPGGRAAADNPVDLDEAALMVSHPSLRPWALPPPATAARNPAPAALCHA